jgi:hypothetical protein
MQRRQWRQRVECLQDVGIHRYRRREVRAAMNDPMTDDRQFVAIKQRFDAIEQ